MKKSSVLRLSFWLALIVILVFGAAFPTFAQQDNPPTDDQVNEIAKGLYCPVCENIPLDVCGTQACAQWRELIRTKLSEGQSAEQIKQYFVDQYGDRVLATPPARGLNWLVYVVPPVVFLLGVVILIFALRSLRAPKGKSDAASAQTDGVQQPPKNEYINRLEEELRKKR